MKQPSLSKLRPVESQTQVDKIESNLRDYFRSEDFKPGDPIPKEMEIAKTMGVSRTAVREALSRFKTLGIIEARKNKGMVLASPDILYSMEQGLNLNLLDDSTLNDIFELRLVIEVGMADLLYRRLTDEKLKALKEIVDKTEKTHNKMQEAKYDVDFHSLLYEITGNKTIQRFQKLLLPIFDYSDGMYPIDISKAPGYVTHRQLLECLQNGTPDEFRIKMRHHLMQYFDKI
jgi:DNA-binding FadR family transcriptional regulator